MTEFLRIVEALEREGVRFVVVGGVAVILQGSATDTRDFDFVVDRTGDNPRRLERALAPHAPYLRGAPPGLPFRWDAATIRRGLNFTLTTDLGDIDLLGEIAGGGTYQDLLPHTEEKEVEGHRIRVIDIPALIRAKRAAGRVKDLYHVAELELIQELKAGRRPPYPEGPMFDEQRRLERDDHGRE